MWTRWEFSNESNSVNFFLFLLSSLFLFLLKSVRYYSASLNAQQLKHLKILLCFFFHHFLFSIHSVISLYHVPYLTSLLISISKKCFESHFVSDGKQKHLLLAFIFRMVVFSYSRQFEDKIQLGLHSLVCKHFDQSFFQL